MRGTNNGDGDMFKGPWWAYVLNRQGLATVLVLFGVFGGSFGLWKTGTWIGSNVLIPLTNRQIKLMDALDESVSTQTKVLDELRLQGAENHDVMIENAQLSQRNNEMLQELFRIYVQPSDTRPLQQRK